MPLSKSEKSNLIQQLFQLTGDSQIKGQIPYKDIERANKIFHSNRQALKILLSEEQNYQNAPVRPGKQFLQFTAKDIQLGKLQKTNFLLIQSEEDKQNYPALFKNQSQQPMLQDRFNTSRNKNQSQSLASKRNNNICSTSTLKKYKIPYQVSQRNLGKVSSFSNLKGSKKNEISKTKANPIKRNCAIVQDKKLRDKKAIQYKTYSNLSKIPSVRSLGKKQGISSFTCSNKQSLNSTKKNITPINTVQSLNSTSILLKIHNKSKSKCKALKKKKSAQKRVFTQCKDQCDQLDSEKLFGNVEIKNLQDCGLRKRSVTQICQSEFAPNPKLISQGYSVINEIIHQIEGKSWQANIEKTQLESYVSELKKQVQQQQKLRNQFEMRSEIKRKKLDKLNHELLNAKKKSAKYQTKIQQQSKKLLKKKRQEQQKLKNMSQIKSEQNQQEQLIKMYTQVIEQVKVQIKKEVYLKHQARNELKLNTKGLDARQNKFKSEYQSVQNIKISVNQHLSRWM